MTIEEKIQQAEEAISRVFADTSVDKETTLENLKGLRDEIEVLIDAVEVDLRAEQ